MEEQTAKTKKTGMSTAKVNPLRNEKVYVRFVPSSAGFASENPRHAMYGGLADGASVTYCVPILRSTGKYKNVLTNEEKDYLEELLGLEYNAMSVYKTKDNFWDNYTVRLTKEGLHLDLSQPGDYISYCVLTRGNPDFIAPSVQERMDRPKNTYRFEIVRENDETTIENAKMDATMASYKEFGKIDNDIDTMRVLVELLDGRPYAANTKIEFLRSRVNILIQDNPKKFLDTITDPMLHAKVLIRRSTELGVLVKRGNYYYLKADNSPLCDGGDEPTLSIAARYINLPSHQDVKFILESAVGDNKGK